MQPRDPNSKPAGTPADGRAETTRAVAPKREPTVTLPSPTAPKPALMVDDPSVRSPNGFFDRAVSRWEALARRGGRRMTDDDVQLIAQGARERYMTGRYIDRGDDDDRVETLPGPVNEGSYVYPVREPQQPARAATPARRVEAQRPATSFDPRFVAPSRWHHESTGSGWDVASYDDWDRPGSDASSSSGRDQWSHEIPRDPSMHGGRETRGSHSAGRREDTPITAPRDRSRGRR